MGKYDALYDTEPPARSSKYAALHDDAPVSAPAPKVESPIFPTAANIPGKGFGPSLKRIGAGVMDVLNMPTRLVATLRGQDMADPNSYFFKKETEAAKAKAQAGLDANPELKNYVPPGGFGGMPMMIPTPAMAPGLTETGGQMASDPTLALGSVAKLAGNAVRKGWGAVLGAIPRLKSYTSGLAQINAPLLEKAATTEGLTKIQAGAKMSPEDLAQQIAGDAGKLNAQREELAANSKLTQQQQVQAVNDQLALENQGINAKLAADAEQENARRALEHQEVNTKAVTEAERENAKRALEHQQVNARLADEAGARGQYQDELAANSRRLQQEQTEAGILAARKKATGADATSLSSIQPGALGEDIKSGIMGGKGDMQTEWLKADQQSIGRLRNSPASTTTLNQEGKEVKIKYLSQLLGDVLDNFKARDPSQGMRKISEGAATVIRDLMDHSETSGHTIDDLLNIKSELRRARSMDKYKGIPFDLSVDDVAFGDSDKAINEALSESIKAAAPKEANTIVDLVKTKDRQYAIAHDLLGDQARTIGQTQNSANIISKVKAMGPEKARALIAGAETNPALRGVVPLLRQAFVDDLILSSMKDGEFSAAAMSKQWNAPGMQEMKAAWMAPEDLKRIDQALELGTAEMGKPAATKALRVPPPQRVEPTLVPRPPRVEAGSVPMPPKIGSPADVSNGFHSRLAREEVGQPPKLGQSFSYNGQPDPTTAKSRVQNIGMENEINQRALADLKVLDKINGTNYAEKAMHVFEAGRLGMNPEGEMARHPMQVTGARGYAAQKGKILGGVVGGLLGLLVDRGFTSATSGSVAGSFVGDAIAAMHSNLGSPAGAVAAFRKMNGVLEMRFPRAAALARTLENTTEPAARARLIAQINQELSKGDNEGGPKAKLGPPRQLQTSKGGSP
jgi:hypothetical protein